MANFDILSQEERENDEETRIPSQKIIRDSSVETGVRQRQRQRRIFQVTEGHRSKKTEDKYRVGFQHFLEYIRISDLDVLLDLGRNAIQELVIKYVLSLRDNPDKKYSRSTVNVYCACILYFFDNNDIELNRRMIKRYYPSDESTHYDADRPYSRREIQQIISSGIDLRTKAMILLMASTGVRIGALHSMQIGDLTPTTWSNHNLYRVQVYARTRDKYYTFCTPECYDAIQEYLNYRKRCREELRDKSPLFRKHFNKHDPFTVNVPKSMSEHSVMFVVDETLKQSGVKTIEARRSHAFRKGFKSICEQSGMKSINVEMLMGHNIGVSGHYYRPAESDVLEDYMTHAADALTIDPNQRLRKQVHQLQSERTEEIDRQSREITTLKAQLSNLTQKYSERRIIRSTEEGGFVIDMKNLEKIEDEIKTLRDWFKESNTPEALAAAAAVEADRMQSKSKIKT